ncbi:MAG: restriction endonuclease subunit S [Eubacterium ventriosum]|uniref:restriction endonuclease subunit S n=1 Tax=Eubacterium ventriosum TaxID=39496 RepID=UPI001DD6F75D|nr:restriction endonuclease subunit S [Eubacterium ventriosum]MBD9056254.1 restriction endonuclease subunit S [Eubacterium ventriosum]
MADIPKIRFKGFTEPWEQRKLSELLYLSSERNDGSYIRDDVLAASLGTELQKKHIYFGLRATDESVKNYKVVLPNDVIYTKSPIKGFPNGIIRTSKGENGIVPTLYCVYHSIDVINPSIIQAYFESKERLDAYLIPLVNIGARNNVNITDKEFLEGAICIPKDKAEQDKIVDVLERLSNLITLHQRKCDDTKELKKYMLQKMFPKNGEKFPEIRFKGFTEAWEQRKLGEILERRVEQRQQSGEYPRLAFASGQGVIPLNERKTNNREQLTKDEFTKKYLVTELDDIVYNPANVKYGAIDRNKCGRGLISPIYVTFTTSEIPGFIERIVTSHDFQQKALRFEEGTVTKRQSVNPEDFVTIDILVAPQKEEQRKISEYFDSLDNLITLHQRKCDTLKELKKYMLQNMFPKKG